MRESRHGLGRKGVDPGSFPAALWGQPATDPARSSSPDISFWSPVGGWFQIRRCMGLPLMGTSSTLVARYIRSLYPALADTRKLDKQQGIGPTGGRARDCGGGPLGSNPASIQRTGGGGFNLKADWAVDSSPQVARRDSIHTASRPHIHSIQKQTAY